MRFLKQSQKIGPCQLLLEQLNGPHSSPSYINYQNFFIVTQFSFLPTFWSLEAVLWLFKKTIIFFRFRIVVCRFQRRVSLGHLVIRDISTKDISSGQLTNTKVPKKVNFEHTVRTISTSRKSSVFVWAESSLRMRVIPRDLTRFV